ncbi:aldo/keto reductase [Nannocystis sp. RBIL2]|uniref:aldo/keto reductase n=1 Tax=Nannocystis sp. RBIL2 TaxID=2996788 RepID=UPI00226E628D|nr:aldo/keto reductase [Nannocystis sp. RBIL2]MCY1066338.1 aldo/keto reductase [Nannocystis sp. RBIL2]
MLSRRALLGVASGLMVGCRKGQVDAADGPRRAAAAAPIATPAAPMATTAATPTTSTEETTMLTRAHPRTHEALPVIGMGTWQTFDVGRDAGERAPLREVLAQFAAAGGRVIDSSPMYGRAEAVAGDLVAETGAPAQPFWATKVWTRGRAEGAAQIDQSMRLLRAERLDLLQVHNLLDFDTHIATLRRLRDAGRVRYLGITHYTHSGLDELERVLRREPLDFVQLPYSAATRAAEQRLLPTAAELGVAVLVMRPFDGGSLFERVKGQPLPAWAADLDCTSFGQLFLKFILGHPAVHCPLPATSSPKHMADNVRAGFGRLPDAAEREKIAALVAG